MTDEVAQSRPDSPRLTSRGLTLLLVGLATLPIVIVGILYVTLPATSSKPLAVDVKIDRDANPPALVIHNQDDCDWSNLSVSINGAFYHYYKHALPQGKELSLPVTAFLRRSGLPFDPAAVEINDVNVAARRVSGHRATRDISFEQGQDP
ncbi:hypothetical protein LOC68_07970 [Blastopirellula sp. JC732]|uniref:Uncharacterized protein n=1 Tax=Blastopirellula sediminis TaxID=2894196 RepID=A0A9X1MJN4_9BACT|nr:hypothetical protein [Blastopirellula sediminis]MCC9608895.1 hypothetical protein [Blastopirellula sediminis]MCC9628328.1 hypothetical protein [Blastopirellula sediminis]